MNHDDNRPAGDLEMRCWNGFMKRRKLELNYQIFPAPCYAKKE